MAGTHAGRPTVSVCGPTTASDRVLGGRDRDDPRSRHANGSHRSPHPDGDLGLAVRTSEGSPPTPGRTRLVWKVRPRNLPRDAEPFRVTNTLPAFLRYDDPDLSGHPSPLQYFHTFTIGYLAIQVFGQTFGANGLGDDGLPLAIMIPRTPIEPLQVRIWSKPDEVVVWPPRQTIANDGIADFAGWASDLKWHLVGLGNAQRVVLAESEGRARFGSQ